MPSEAVGIEDPNVIKDEQMTASNYVTHSKYGPQNARLYSGVKWRALNRDVSAWLQVKLNEVTTIRKVAVQGCGSNAWVKTFKLSFSIDGVYWTSYKENLTEKVCISLTPDPVSSGQHPPNSSVRIYEGSLLRCRTARIRNGFIIRLCFQHL